MASAIQKITLAASRDIPFNKLVLSQSNVRRIKAGVSVEELAESIARRGLIQSLHVRAVLDAEGQESGIFEVPAGGRRYRALQLLVKQKRLGKAAPVPCVVSASEDVLIDEVSLAENIERAPLHPLDQFRAFQAMRVKGMTEEAIAAAFFVAVQLVKQRLRIAAVSHALLSVYAEDGMTLEMLMAFTVSEDHARQEQVWEAVRNSWQKEPYQIRRMLTETAVRASDKRALFVGTDTYEAAGGAVLRDLFEADDGGWLQDVGLLDRLATEKLNTAAAEIASEGWKWVEVAPSFPYGVTDRLRRLAGEPLDRTVEEQATIEAFNAEYGRLEAEYETSGELPDEIDERLGEIEAALARFEQRPARYDPVEMAQAGVFVSIGLDGTLSVERGFVRPHDEVQAAAEGEGSQASGNGGDAADPSGLPGQSTVVSISSSAHQPEDDEDDGIRPLPDRLLSELTAHRTLALRDALANNPRVAMTALLHKLVGDTFLGHAATGCMEASVRQVSFPLQAGDLQHGPSAKSIAQRHADWRAELPTDDDALWVWLSKLDEASRMALLAHCVSLGVNALYEKATPCGGYGVTPAGLKLRLAQADRLAQTIGLDMAEAGWRPTVDNYLGRVTKTRILEAVCEGAGERSAQLIDHLKKAEMAREAERLLADTGWLPEPLRTAGLDGDRAMMPSADIAEGIDSLPAFLTAGEADDGAGEMEGEEARMIAAE